MTLFFSTSETIEKEMRSLFSIDDGTPVRIWSHINADTYELITNMENTVTGAGLFQGSNLVIEQKNKDGTWPRPAERYVNGGMNITLAVISIRNVNVNNSLPSLITVRGTRLTTTMEPLRKKLK